MLIVPEEVILVVEIEAGCDGRPGLSTLEPTDGELLGRLFERLSAESIYWRFFSPISRPDVFVGSLSRLDHVDREALAAVVGGEVVGVAQYVRRAGESRADMAIVIEDAWQRQGIGTRLIAALAERAAAAGIESFTVEIQGDNFGALKLFQRVAPGGRLAFSAGVGEGVIPLPPAAAQS